MYSKWKTVKKLPIKLKFGNQFLMSRQQKSKLSTYVGLLTFAPLIILKMTVGRFGHITKSFKNMLADSLFIFWYILQLGSSQICIMSSYTSVKMHISGHCFYFGIATHTMYSSIPLSISHITIKLCLDYIGYA